MPENKLEEYIKYELRKEKEELNALDIVIHLYKSGKKELLYSSFDKLYIYDFLFEKEMKSKFTQVYEEFKNDVDIEKSL